MKVTKDDIEEDYRNILLQNEFLRVFHVLGTLQSGIEGAGYMCNSINFFNFYVVF